MKRYGNLLDDRAPAPATDPRSMDRLEPAAPAPQAWCVDDTLEDSFPASDPPPWSTGIARPAPAAARPARGRRPVAKAAPGVMPRVAALR